MDNGMNDKDVTCVYFLKKMEVSDSKDNLSQWKKDSVVFCYSVTHIYIFFSAYYDGHSQNERK